MLRRTALTFGLALPLVVAASVAVMAQRTPAPANAKVSFANIKNGDTVTSPFTVQFALTGMTIGRAGTHEPNSGHHHLLIDTRLEPGMLAFAIAADDKHRHFGAGQTEVSLTLPAGQHTLQLVFADGNHIPHDPPVASEVITITVR
jgi:Domain of unknown function (DUF4399)